MPLSYLQPISDDLLNAPYKEQQLGFSVIKNDVFSVFPDLSEVQIAFFCVETPTNDWTDFRNELYRLYRGNWHVQIADLGNLPQGATANDTHVALSDIIAELISQKIVPVVIGGEHHLTYGLYRAFDKLEQMVNLVSVDACFDFDDEEALFSSESYMSRMLSEKPTNLHDFTNLGYQSYLNAQETLDLLDKMYFETYRLGSIAQDMTIVEPAMRDADVVSVDMCAVQAKDLGSSAANVNGFSNREICTLSRYAGISSNVQVLGVFDIPDTNLAMQLTAQMLWYFTEGLNFRVKELPTVNDHNYTKYIVPIDDFQLEFFKSNATGRWWIKPYDECSQNELKHLPLGLLPCNHSEYLQAIEGTIPERWWKAYRKALT